MTNETTPIRMSELGELVAAVPVLLGFHPARSLTVILLKGTRVVLTVRIDLPDAEESAYRYADHLAGALTARDNVDADRAALIVVDRLPHEDVVSRVAQALAWVGIAADPMVWAEGTRAGQRWACHAGCHQGLVPAATPLQVASAVDGRAVLPSRAAVAASIAPVVDEPTLRTRAAMATLALTDPSARRFVTPQVMSDALREWRDGRLVFDDARVALLALALADTTVRNHVATWTIRDCVDDAHTFWMELVRQTPPPFVAEPASLLALTAMVKGDGVLAEAALNLAEAANPGHARAGLVRALHELNLSPSEVRRALGQAAAS